MGDTHLLCSWCPRAASASSRHTPEYACESLQNAVRNSGGTSCAEIEELLTTQARDDNLARLEIADLEPPGRRLVPARLDVICRRS